MDSQNRRMTPAGSDAKTPRTRSAGERWTPPYQGHSHNLWVATRAKALVTLQLDMRWINKEANQVRSEGDAPRGSETKRIP